MALPVFVNSTLFDSYVITACLFALMAILLAGLFRKTWNGFLLLILIFAVLFYVIPIITMVLQLNYGNLGVIRNYNYAIISPNGIGGFLDYPTNQEYANDILWQNYLPFFVSSVSGVIVGSILRKIVLIQLNTIK